LAFDRQCADSEDQRCQYEYRDQAPEDHSRRAAPVRPANCL
jgi:hypothetical protein